MHPNYSTYVLICQGDKGHGNVISEGRELLDLDKGDHPGRGDGWEEAPPVGYGTNQRIFSLIQTSIPRCFRPSPGAQYH